MSAGREVFRFENLEYDVTGLNELARRRGFRYGPHKAPINENMLYGVSLYQEPDQKVIDGMSEARRDEPMLVVTLQNGMVRIVDGNHRLRRRVKDGLSDVWQFTIPYSDALPYIREI